MPEIFPLSDKVSKFQQVFDPKLLRSQMDSGRVRQRQNKTKVFAKAQVELDLTTSENVTFQFFWKNINYGNDWFTMGVYTGFGSDGLPTQRLVRIVGGSFRSVPRPVLNYRVSFAIEYEVDSSYDA